MDKEMEQVAVILTDAAERLLPRAAKAKNKVER